MRPGKRDKTGARHGRNNKRTAWSATEIIEEEEDTTTMEDGEDGAASYFCNDLGSLQAAVRIDDIKNIFYPLSRPHTEWNPLDVERAVPVLRNRINFVAGGCKAESQALWGVFVGELDKYLAQHPLESPLSEHVYVSFEFPNGAIPPSFFADIATMDARARAFATMRADGSRSNTLFAVASRDAAGLFVGRIKSFHPTMAANIFTSSALTSW